MRIDVITRNIYIQQILHKMNPIGLFTETHRSLPRQQNANVLTSGNFVE